jgi:hypothetical protein
VVCVLAGAAASGQPPFSSPATTDDGARVWFSTSLRLSGSDQPAHGKIFSASPEHVALVASRLREFRGESHLTNFFDLGFPEVSGDGSVCSYLGAFEGYLLYTSRLAMSNESTVTGVPGRTEQHLEGRARLSRNGRWALMMPSKRSASLLVPATDMSGVVRIVDLSTGRAVEVGGGFYTNPVAATGRVIASNGAAVFSYTGRTSYPEATLFLARPDVPAKVLATDAGSGGLIDDAGAFVIYSSLRGVIEHTIATGAERVLAGAPFAMSNDGARWLSMGSTRGPTGLVVSTLNLYERSTGAARTLATGAIEAAISGDGRVVWLMTLEGLFQVDLANDRRRLIPVPPQSEAYNRTVSPGSTYVIP